MLSIFIIFLFSVTNCYAQYYKPCVLDDYTCITTVLAANSDCTTGVYHSVPPSVTSLNVRFEVPFVNTTIVEQYATWKNIGNCSVAAFYFNETANVAVLAIECPNLVLIRNKMKMRHSPRGEDKIYFFKHVSRYPTIRLTTNLLPADDIDFCRSITFAYITGYPEETVTPKDVSAAAYMKSLAPSAPSNRNIDLREDFRHRAAPVFRTYVNSMLCDFGCV